MSRSSLWRSVILAAATCSALAYASDASPGVFVSAGIAFGLGACLPLLWEPIKRCAYEVLGRFDAFDMATWRLRFDAAMKTMQRTFTGWQQRHRSAPGHSWRHCAST